MNFINNNDPGFRILDLKSMIRYLIKLIHNYNLNEIFFAERHKEYNIIYMKKIGDDENRKKITFTQS